MTAPAALGRRRRRGGVAWSPRTLFANGEPGAWYDPSDFSTLFQDSAGTTPVTALGQPVGAALDARNTAYSVFFDGSGDAFTCATSANWAFGTGDFTVEAWVYRASATATGPVLLFVNATAGFMIYLVSNKVVVRAISVADVLTSSANLTQNAWVHLAVARSGTTLSLWLNGSRANGGTVTNSTNWAQGTLSINSSTGGQEFLGYFRDVRIVKGTAVYDPTQATIAVPTAPLTAIANTVLLTCGNSAAGNPTITVSGNPRIDGLNPFSAVPGNHAIQPTSASRPTVQARVNLLVATATLSTQSVTTGATSYQLQFSGAGTITLSGTATGTLSAGTHTITATAGTLTLTVSGTVTDADLRLASDAAYPYQRVVTATNYADVGAPRRFLFDGVDDSLYTAANLNLSGTDKVTVLAGVRKLSDAAQAALAELSATIASNNGTFLLSAPNSAAANYNWSSKGTTQVDNTVTTYAAPTTNVLTGQADIAGTSNIIRVDGTQAGSSNSSQGTGNFGSYVLNIGRRNNASLPFNGAIFQLIVRGAATDAASLAQAERFVAAKTGVTIP